jgi:hypothetical protein
MLNYNYILPFLKGYESGIKKSLNLGNMDQFI